MARTNYRDGINTPEQNERAILSHIIDNYSELRPNQIAAIMATFKNECAFNSMAHNRSEDSYGLCQWRGDRLDNLRAFARDQGKSADDPTVQIHFMMHEMGIARNGQELSTRHGGGSEREAGERLLAARNIDDAISAMARFERYLGWNTDGYRETRERLADANTFLPGVQVAVADDTRHGPGFGRGQAGLHPDVFA